MGLRGVADPESVGYYKNVVDERMEFQRKVRTVLRGISVFTRSVAMLNPLRYGLFSWQLFSHKLCRWLVPFAMILAFVANAFLVFDAPGYMATFMLQAAFYSLAFSGMQIHLCSKLPIVKIPSFLVLVNLSILSAWYWYFKGERLITWEPSKR